MRAPPPRVRWAVQQLGHQPGNRVLEIGPGRGHAAELLLVSGGVYYVAVDRSAVAVEATRQRLRGRVEEGVATVVHGEARQLGELGLPPFDVAFAVNVNLFWTSAATVELAALRRLLGPSRGRLHLVYEAPGPEQARRIRDLTRRHLHSAGFVTFVSFPPADHARRDGLFAITAHEDDSPTASLTSRTSEEMS